MPRGEPKTRCDNTWSDGRFMSFIRSHLRSMSRRWAPIVSTVFLLAQRPYVGENKRQKWEYQCNHCKLWFKRTEVAADHVIPCGALRTLDDAADFIRRLLVEVDGLQVLCHSCHKVKTDQETADRKLKEGD